MPVGQCSLCQEMKDDLRDSHLLPRSVYRLLRTPASDDPNPVLITKERAMITPRQVTAPLLCGGCEDLFSKNGETWAMANCDRGSEGFRLRDLLTSAPPLARLPNALVYSAAVVPDVRVDMLAYFAASLIWRSSATVWKAFGAVAGSIQLGPYHEDFRLFLLGEKTFPLQARLAVTISLCDETLPAAYAPFTTKLPECYRHSFVIPGIRFDVFVGGQIDDRERSVCFLRSPEHIVFATTEFNDRIVEAGTNALRTAKPVGKLGRGRS